MLQLKPAINLQCLRQPLKTALVTAARLGATGVEINGRTELKPSDMSRTAVRHLRKMLADLNLSVASIHFPTQYGYDSHEKLEQRIEGTKAALSMAYDLGATVVTNRIGRIPADTEDPRWNVLIQSLTDIGQYSQKAGAWLVARTGTEPSDCLQQLLDALPSYSLGIDFDPGELLIQGFDVTESLRTLSPAVMNFRARDAVHDIAAGRALEVQMGRGSIAWAELLGILEKQNYQGYVTIERQGADNPLLECAQGIDFLTKLFR